MSDNHKTAYPPQNFVEMENIIDAMLSSPIPHLTSPFSSSLKEGLALSLRQYTDKEEDFPLNKQLVCNVMSVGCLSPIAQDRLAAIASLYEFAATNNKTTNPNTLSLQEQSVNAATFLCQAAPFSSLPYATQALSTIKENTIPIMNPTLIQAIALTATPDQVCDAPTYIDHMKSAFELACDYGLSSICQTRLCQNWDSEVRTCATSHSFSLSAAKARKVLFQDDTHPPSPLRACAGRFILEHFTRYKLVRQGFFLSLHPQDLLLAHAEKCRDLANTLERIAATPSLSPCAQENLSAVQRDEEALRQQIRISHRPPSLPIRTDSLICK